MTRSGSKGRSGTQSIERAFAVLNAVSALNESGAALASIMQAVRLNRTTTYRVLRCLEQQRAVRVGAGSRYFLGPLATELGAAARRESALKELFSPILDRLAHATGDTVFLLERSGDYSVCVDRRSGAYPVKVLIVDVGTRRPLGIGAAGLVLLHDVTEQELLDVTRRNAAHLVSYGTTKAAVLESVRRNRKRGYVSARAQGVPGVSAVALPVKDRHGKTIAALAVTAIDQRMSRSRQRELVAMLRVETARVEALLRKLYVPGSDE